jgi:hypothetical protein
LECTPSTLRVPLELFVLISARLLTFAFVPDVPVVEVVLEVDDEEPEEPEVETPVMSVRAERETVEAPTLVEK